MPKKQWRTHTRAAWATIHEYSFEKENLIRSRLFEIDKQIENLKAQKLNLIDDLKSSYRLRNLLFEKGKPLELAILDALKLLGFSTSQFNNGESEFDVVFESHEGRLIGEAEGKDSKSVNIDKLRHLATKSTKTWNEKKSNLQPKEYCLAMHTGLALWIKEVNHLQQNV